MPFTRISLKAGKSREHLQALTASLNEALVESFEVPIGDRFVVIHQHQPDELIYDPHYQGGPRSDDFVLFHITTGKQRALETKRAFYEALVGKLTKAPGIRPEDVMIVIANSTLEDWSFASGRCAADSS